MTFFYVGTNASVHSCQQEVGGVRDPATRSLSMKDSDKVYAEVSKFLTENFPH